MVYVGIGGEIQHRRQWRKVKDETIKEETIIDEPTASVVLWQDTEVG